MKGGHKRVLAEIERAAALGRPCPTNMELADMLRAASASVPSRYLSELEDMGIIRVTRGKIGRVITITRTGQSTRETKLRRAPKNKGAPRPLGPWQVQNASADPIPPADVVRTTRFACWRCGANSDAGCAHSDDAYLQLMRRVAL